MDGALLSLLVSPHDQSPLQQDGDELVSASGHRYPIIDDLPVLLRHDVPQTLWVAQASLEAATLKQGAPFYVQTIGLSEEERTSVEKTLDRWLEGGQTGIDPVASHLVAATSGHLYKPLQGRLLDYPVPDMRLPEGNGARFLEIGCNWGRWILAAARQGYTPIGVDPSLGAVLAAKRICHALGISAHFVVADGRYLPFKRGIFDVVFSYSVLQHLSKTDAKSVLAQANDVLKVGGASLLQFPNRYGIRNALYLAQRGFREGENFEVRYYTPQELRTLLTETIGTSQLTVDGYFGLGIQKSDYAIMSTPKKAIIATSELLRTLSMRFPPLIQLADSLYVYSTKDSG